MVSMSHYRTSVDPDAPNNPHSFAIGLVGSAKRVLEVGCSVGHVTEHLVARGNDLVGIEIDPDAAAEARRYATRVHVLDIDLVPVSDVEEGPFDVIVLGDVLEHLRDPAAAMRDLAGLLTPDGSFVISVPNVGHVDVRLMLMHGRWEYQPDGLLDRDHLRWFTKSSLRQLLADVGFVAVDVKRVVIGVGGSMLPTGDRDSEIMRYLEADPELYTYQFVVEGRRSGEDLLMPEESSAWPQLGLERERRDSEVAALKTHNEALRNEVEAWHNARIVRYTRPLRSLWSKIRRTPTAP